jgi:hypothetical protein
MRSKLREEMTRRWSEYERFRKEGVTYSAIVRVSEMENCLSGQIGADGEAEKWNELVRSVKLNDIEAQRACDEAQRQLARLERIVGTGLNLNYEELLLAITLRVELELFTGFCADRGIACAVHPEVADADMIALASSKESGSLFKRAKAAAKANWGVPLKSHWLQHG